MARVRWRVVRAGFEKQDLAFNESLAERLLAGEAADDFAIALDQCGFKIVPQSPALASEKWPLTCRDVLVPSWCVSVAESDAQARAGAHVACDIDKHRPRPRACGVR
jgi:hypothetical protein